MVQEQYGVQLTSEERERLRQLIRSGQHSARVITRARILLRTDEGWSASQVVAALDTSQRRCSAPNGGTPKKDWTACCTTIPKPTGIVSWMTRVKPT